MTGRYWKRPKGGWAVALYVDGVEHRESVAKAIGKPADRVTEADAKALLEYRQKEIAQGRFVPLKDAKRPFRELYASYLEDVKLRGRQGPVNGHSVLILERWGDVVGANISAPGIRKWLNDLQARGYSLGTCSVVMGYLRAAMRLAVSDNRLARTPKFPVITLRNARKGFFEPEHFTAIHAHLVEPIHDLAEFYYEVGWRRREAQGLRWEWVERGRRIVLPDSKNGEGRVVPMVGRVNDIIERRWSKREYRRPDGTTALSEWVFHRQGRPVRDFRSQWATACAKAGVQRLVHDFRRTVMRDGVQAGSDIFTVMAITGHKSLTTAQRYNIIDTRRVASALQRTADYRRGQTHTDSVVRLGGKS